jgi:hypothetical protein
MFPQSKELEMKVKEKVAKRSVIERVIDSKKGMTVHIDGTHVKTAKRSDESGCVVAEACKAEHGEAYDDFSIGATIAKARRGTTLVRFSLDSKLRKAVREYDLTGKWTLPAGEYKLQPIHESKQLSPLRHKDKPKSQMKKINGRKQGKFVARAVKATPAKRHRFTSRTPSIAA